jgi:signal transduction histidine kinase
MNGVIGMTDWLLVTELNEEQRKCALIIRKSADALLSIINDILDFSKIETGQIKLETVDFDMFTIVNEVTDMLTCRAQEKEICFLVDLPVGDRRAFNGDPLRLRQILLNLAGNAVKFTEKGHDLEVNISAIMWRLEPEKMKLAL